MQDVLSRKKGVLWEILNNGIGGHVENREIYRRVFTVILVIDLRRL